MKEFIDVAAVVFQTAVILALIGGVTGAAFTGSSD